MTEEHDEKDDFSPEYRASRIVSRINDLGINSADVEDMSSIHSDRISIPAEIIFSIKILADPSKIGTSSLSISINALSIPNPNNAHIKCSIVETLTPNSFSIVVFNEVLVTFIKFG